MKNRDKSIIINSLSDEGFEDIVVLTCKTEHTSVLSEFSKDGKYRNKYLFTTCRKFKGLEADAVVLIDVDRNVFKNENPLIYYVGASRARIRLEIFAVLSDDDCQNILNEKLNYGIKIRNPKKDFAAALNTIGSLEN